ncbi:SH3 domain-containing protein [Sphingobium sp. DEHP117]|uniref:SH3 domain-containing protein n=1 Tax=Sphingobium sp. DEHP117 TaxID=2993436 RepID=UPI0035A10FCA
MGYARVRGVVCVVLLAAAALGARPAYAGPKTPPYWASIAADEARMRVGPSLDYPSNWIYQRRDMPVKVVQVLGNWRKIQDPDGTQGWMHVRLLSDTATAMVRDVAADMRQDRSDATPLLYRAEQGVVGRVSDCGEGWCRFDVSGKRGYVRASSLWGAVK